MTTFIVMMRYGNKTFWTYSQSVAIGDDFYEIEMHTKVVQWAFEDLARRVGRFIIGKDGVGDGK
jgi:hypothetical protein